jgi:hypothetical protein
VISCESVVNSRFGAHWEFFFFFFFFCDFFLCVYFFCVNVVGVGD